MKNEIYIGDNLTVMSGLFEKYLGQIKMIYIDPPYNTGSRFSYEDRKDSSDWKEFMKKRLSVSKYYLCCDGVIFISIDDNEYATLKIICDEVFGKNNFVGTFITFQAQRSNAKHINTVHEYILAYAKNKSRLEESHIRRTDIPEDREMIEELYRDIKNA
ncbi:MAG: site-specific DNA-methyltransferase, partial [Armatimonadetes bacterium]|nr:site-specific DNA-methyltransferase [Candidatus Hippobium faecium]